MSAYYNENDPKAAAWLRELIAQDLIAPGDVDERDIKDVQPNDLEGYTQHHFFAGIGGWSLALKLAGWPDDRPAWTGSCPCQPFSAAGRRTGTDDPRHLWPIWFNLINARQPPIIFGEQVASAPVIGKSTMQGVRGNKASGRVPKTQPGRLSVDVSPVRELVGSINKTMGLGRQEKLSTPSASHTKGNGFGERCQASGQKVELGVRPRLEGVASEDRYGFLRSVKSSFRSERPAQLERAITGSNNPRRWVHDGEYSSSSLCGQYHGQRMGIGSGSGNSRRREEQNVNGFVAKASGENERNESPVWIDGVFNDLEDAHYTCGAVVFPACGISAPHIRQRLWWVAEAGGTGRLGLPDSARRESRVASGKTVGYGNPAVTTSGTGGVGDSDITGPQGWGVGGDGSGERAPGPSGMGFWSIFDLIPCADGKSRRVESGTFPLVARLPRGVVPGGDPSISYCLSTAEARTVRLRGYGNSIVPQVAAEFIRAYCDSSVENVE